MKDRERAEDEEAIIQSLEAYAKTCSLEKTTGESLEEEKSVCAAIDDDFFSFLSSDEESEQDASGDLKSPPEDISNVKK